MAAINDCIIWDKYITPSGYGHIKRDGKPQRVHKYLYEQRFGKVPSGYVLDHLCRNKACINVLHLEVVTVAENTRRGKSAKLDYRKVEEIKNMYKQGKRQVDIGLIFGVGQDQISRIVNNRRWV